MGKKNGPKFARFQGEFFFPKSQDFYDKFQLLVKNIERPWFYFLKNLAKLWLNYFYRRSSLWLDQILYKNLF
jgi:hypothetical protein